MYIQDTVTPSVKETNFLIKKKVIYVSLGLGISILIGCVLITHYITKINDEKSIKINNCTSTQSYQNKLIEQDCKNFFCVNSAIINGKFKNFFYNFTNLQNFVLKEWKDTCVSKIRIKEDKINEKGLVKKNFHFYNNYFNMFEIKIR